jgi:hypothetical protein
MRQALFQWFRIPQSEEAELWKNGLISFDASVLLNIYAYSNETRNELVSLIEANADRVRLPHQFGLEYARNRGAVIVKQVNNYLKAEKVLKDFQTEQIESKRDHPYLGPDSMKALESIRADLASRRKEMEKLIGADSYADKLLAVFDGKLSPAPNSEEIAKLHKCAKERYNSNLPPGYADLKDKAEPEAFGDCVGWMQLIEIARNEKRGCLLVIDDLKEDWWLIEKERTIGPRPELLAEFAAATDQKLWIYNSVNFLRAARTFKMAEIGDLVIKEISERIASQLEQMRSPKASTQLQEPLKASAGDVAKTVEKELSTEATEEKASSPELEKTASPNDAEKVT